MLVSRLTGRGGGLAVSGLIAEVIAPDIYQHIGSTLKPDLVFVTGTNGKTSTTNLISEIITAKGAKVVSNHSGANIARGISGAYIGSLFGSASRGGARAGVFEVDEAVVPQLATAMNPSVQKGAKIVQKVGVETVKVATPIVAKGVATGIKEGGKLAFKVALGANSMGNERREKKEAKKIVENKSNGNSPSWKKNEGIFKSGKVPFSFGNVDEKEEEEEENRNVFGSLFGGDGKNESQTPPKKKRTDIFGRERD